MGIKVPNSWRDMNLDGFMKLKRCQARSNKRKPPWNTKLSNYPKLKIKFWKQQEKETHHMQKNPNDVISRFLNKNIPHQEGMKWVKVLKTEKRPKPDGFTGEFHQRCKEN